MSSATTSSLPPTEAARQLRSTMSAARLSFTWFGTHKSLTSAQKAEVADTFGAASPFLSAGKKLLDTRDPRYQAVTSIRTRACSYWKGVTLPYPEPGVRLIRQEWIREFDTHLTDLRTDLQTAVAQLDHQFSALKSAARERLGRLYASSDYPDSLHGLFDLSWEFPSLEPPDYLRQLSPELYEQESARVRARFEEAVQLAEQGFIEELSHLVNHLTERLSGADDGQPKVFRDSAVGNLREFFVRFGTLNVRSHEQLDRLVHQCHQIVGNLEPQQLRNQPALRQQIATQLSGVQATLDGLLVERPRRRLLR